jgi:hypothetical protein
MDQQQIEMKLWDYIDGMSAAEERSVIEKLIAEKSEWNAKYHELLDMDQLIKATELEQPSMRFTKNVMEEIARYQIAPAAKIYINKKIIWGIAAFFISVIAAFIIYGIIQVNWSEGTSDNNVLGYDVTRINYSRMFDNTYLNLFMMFNIVLGLMLLDRYLGNRNKKLMGDG